MRKNGVNSAPSLKTAITIMFNNHDFLKGEQNFGDTVTG